MYGFTIKFYFKVLMHLAIYILKFLIKLIMNTEKRVEILNTLIQLASCIFC